MRANKSPAFHPGTKDFLDSVLNRRPRFAAFDCDGTLWSGDAGVEFFEWTLREEDGVPRILAEGFDRDAIRERHAAYRRGEVNETAMCGEMTTMYCGATERQMLEAARLFFEKMLLKNVFPEMRELVRRLHEQGCEIWAVSSSNEWTIREAMKYFDIPAERILASKVELDGDVATNRLIRVPSGAGKREALREIAGKEVDAAFGNSRWDAEMLGMAKHAFAVNPNPDLEATARERGWTVYFPEALRTR